MISALIKYSAVTAKARAMYGKCLTDGQWERLLEAKSLRAVWELVRKSGAWAAVAEQPRCAEDEKLFIRALAEQLDRDRAGLGGYLDKEDKACLRAFPQGQDGGQAAPPEQYQRWWGSDRKKFAGSTALTVAEADAMNLVYILRLRRFPGSKERAGTLLIPLRKDLTPRLVEELLGARDDEAVLALLRQTRWGGVFQSLEPGELEKQYETYMREFCRHIIASARPGLAVVQAFLPLKDMERRRLTRLVGAVARGMDPRLAV